MPVHWVPKSRLDGREIDTIPVTRPSLQGGQTTRGRRLFYYVSPNGERMRDTSGRLYPAYAIGPQMGPVDAARKVVHRVLQTKDTSKMAKGRRVPSSVRDAVDRAVRQNFMCECRGRCRSDCIEVGRRLGEQYVEDYLQEPPQIFNEHVIVHIRESGKDKVRRYRGCYRRVTNPNKHCIRRGIRKETVATYQKTLTT